MSYKNPFKDAEEGSKTWKDWKALLKRCPDLSNDMAMRVGKEWNGTYPWHEAYRESYLEPEVPLEEKWEHQMLAKRSRAETNASSKSKCLRGVIELDNLERDKNEYT